MPRLHILVFTLAACHLTSKMVEAVELVSLDWEHRATVDLRPPDRSPTCAIGLAPQHPHAPDATVSAESIDELGCGSMVFSLGEADSSNVDTSDPFRDEFIIRTQAGANLRSIPIVIGGVPRVAQVSSLSVARFSNDVSGSGGIVNSISVSLSNSYPVPVTVSRSVEATSIGIFDTDINPLADISSRNVRLIVTHRSEHDDAAAGLNMLTGIARVFDHDTGELLWSSELGEPGQTDAFIPFRDRLGHQVRVEFSAVGGLSAATLPPNRRGGARQHLSLNTLLFVPEPGLSLVHLLACILLARNIVQSRRARQHFHNQKGDIVL